MARLAQLVLEKSEGPARPLLSSLTLGMMRAERFEARIWRTGLQGGPGLPQGAGLPQLGGRRPGFWVGSGPSQEGVARGWISGG